MSKRGMIGNILGTQLKSSAEQLHGIQLSGVEYMKLTELRENPLNADFFTTESDENLKRLEDDVRERGILVPLIAKDDGTLLAGHNRLRIAKTIGLESVPVQRVLGSLNANDERAFLVKDNLLRRQLSQSDWIAVYKKLYPEFEALYLQQPNREQESSEPFDNSTSVQGAGAQSGKAGRTKTGDTNRLTLAKIAAETGQSIHTVKSQVKRERGKFKAAAQPQGKTTAEKIGGNAPHFSDRGENDADKKIGGNAPHLSKPDEKTGKSEHHVSKATDISLTNLQTTLKHIEEFYRTSEPDTRKAVENTLIQFMSNLSLIAENKL